jgi:predicted 3-demethylubiquinone-9 3-methyltransferase (glyoxalase superfamily)
MKKVTPFLWFNQELDPIVNFYLKTFRNSKILWENRQQGKLFMASIEIESQELQLLNGGPVYELNPAFSLFVKCENQKEVDYYWDLLSEGGATMKCGWLSDKFGLSWQIIPEQLGRYLGDKDPAKAGRVMDAMLKMTKINIEELTKAYERKQIY